MEVSSSAIYSVTGLMFGIRRTRRWDRTPPLSSLSPALFHQIQIWKHVHGSWKRSMFQRAWCCQRWFRNFLMDTVRTCVALGKSLSSILPAWRLLIWKIVVLWIFNWLCNWVAAEGEHKFGCVDSVWVFEPHFSAKRAPVSACSRGKRKMRQQCQDWLWFHSAQQTEI